MLENKKIAIIGCGNLGHSIANGLLEKIPAKNISASKRNLSSLQDLAEKGVHISSDNIEIAQQADIIILGLKPYNIYPVIETLNPSLKDDKQIIISLATGISLENLHEKIQAQVPIFRAMPNTAADVNESMTCISTYSKKQEDLDLVKEVFTSIGSAIYIDENLMNAATVIDACGIAYVLRFIRAMIQGGIQIGFDAQTATDIVTHTVKGAAQLLIENRKHPEEEIDKVTTPKGCTIVGLNEMEHNGFSSALIKGIVASYEEIS